MKNSQPPPPSENRGEIGPPHPGSAARSSESGAENRKRPFWLRWLVPVLLVFTWLAIAGIGGPTFGRLEEVSSNDQASFLPAGAEATAAQDWQAKFRDTNEIPAVIVIESDSAFTPAQLGEVAALKGDLEAVGAGSTVIGPIPSEDGKAVQFVVPIDSAGEVKEVVAELRDEVQASAPEGMQTFVTGPAGLTADLVSAFAGIDGILLLVALGAVFLILLIVYRSLLLPIVVLFTSVFALCAAILLVFGMAKLGWIQLNGQSQGILSILVIGAATDYALLYVARFREALTHTTNRTAAALTAWKNSLGTHRCLRRHGHHRAALPAVLRPQLQQGPRPGGRSGHPLLALRRADPAAGADGAAGPRRVLALPAQAAPGDRARA